MITKAPSDGMRLLGGGQAQTVAAGATGVNMATFVDGTPFEYLIYVLTVGAITGSTGLDLKAQHADNAAGTTNLANVDDIDGSTDLINTLNASSTPVLAAGVTIALIVRTHGAKKYHSPHVVVTGGTSIVVHYSVWGFNPKDTHEIVAGWKAASAGNPSAAFAGVGVAGVSLA